MVGRYILKRIRHNHARELRKLFFFFFFFFFFEEVRGKGLGRGWGGEGAETAETVEHGQELRKLFFFFFFEEVRGEGGGGWTGWRG